MERRAGAAPGPAARGWTPASLSGLPPLCSAVRRRGGRSPAWLPCQRDGLGLASSPKDPPAPGGSGPEELCARTHSRRAARGARPPVPGSRCAVLGARWVPGGWLRLPLRGDGTGPRGALPTAVPLAGVPLAGGSGGSQARGGCAHGWGMWAHRGGEAGACPCLPAASIGSCASGSRPAAAFPGQQLRPGARAGVLGPRPAAPRGQVGALRGPAAGEPSEALLGSAGGAWSPPEQRAGSDVRPLLVRVAGGCHRGSRWRHRLRGDLSGVALGPGLVAAE